MTAIIQIHFILGDRNLAGPTAADFAAMDAIIPVDGGYGPITAEELEGDIRPR